MTTATSSQDFAKRLDATAADTEALLGQLLSDTLLPDEIARPRRVMEAMSEATAATCDALARGLPCSQVNEAALAPIRAAGLGDAIRPVDDG